MSTQKRRQLESRLDGRQKIAALACVEREFAPDDARKGFEEIAAEAGVSRNTLYEWRTQNKAFIEYVNFVADDYLEARRAQVYRQLMRLIDGQQPSVKAIDLYLRRHGLLTERSVVETIGAGSTNEEDDIAKEIADLDGVLADE